MDHRLGELNLLLLAQTGEFLGEGGLKAANHAAVSALGECDHVTHLLILAIDPQRDGVAVPDCLID